jgi:hypothetical protein
MLGQESLQVLVGDPKDTFESVRYKLARVDPAANRPHRDPQRFRDVANGEKFHMIFAIAPSADGGVSEVDLRFDQSAMSHVDDRRSLPPSPPHARAASFPSLARSSMRWSAATGTLIRRPIRTDGICPACTAWYAVDRPIPSRRPASATSMTNVASASVFIGSISKRTSFLISNSLAL